MTTINNVTVDILVNSKPITEYYKNGRTFIEGRKGSKYILRVHNNTSNKILVVPSVDGLSVLDGKPANKYTSRGYIINPRGYTDIDGWRTSNSESRKFEFGKVGKSYNQKTDNDVNNVGVIGISCFQEKYTYRRTYYDDLLVGASNIEENSLYDNTVGRGFSDVPSSIMYSATGSSASSQANGTTRSIKLKSAEVGASIGTKMGDKQYSPVTTVNFTRADSSFADFVFYYHDRKTLKQMGIVPESRKSTKGRPNPFPENPEFCREV